MYYYHSYFFLSALGVGKFNESNVLDEYATEMTPAPWGSNVWQLLLALQVRLWSLYRLISYLIFIYKRYLFFLLYYCSMINFYVELNFLSGGRLSIK